MKYRLTDLINVTRTKELLDSFFNAGGIPAAIIDLEGVVLVTSRWRRMCKDFHRANENTCKKCIESDTVLANELLQEKRFSLYRCPHGLTDAASPITIEGEHVANAFIGQFFLSEPDIEFFRRQADEYGFDEAAYLESLSEIPVVAEENLPSILSFLTSFAEMIAVAGLKQLRQLEVEDALRKARGELELRIEERTEELSSTNRKLLEEIEERKLAERHIKAGNALLRLMAEADSRKEYLDGALELVTQWTGCRCAGIRVLDSRDNIPYESYMGFDREFWSQENWLSLSWDNCICTRIIRGSPEPQDAPCISPGGSFVCNNTREFAEGLSREKLGRFRGVCIASGFSSVAVIPLRHKRDLLGAIHLADEREGMLPENLVAFMEGMSSLIGDGIHGFNLKDDLKHQYTTQEIINSLLELSLTDIGVDELLRQALDLLLSIPWLTFQSMAAIFFLDEGSGQLTLKAQKGLDQKTQKRCERIELGDCLCLEEVLGGKIRFFDHEQEKARAIYSEMFPHAHYCVPIQLQGRTLGVINVFVNEEYRAKGNEETFFTAVANTLSGIIYRRKLETSLRNSERRFHAIFDQAIQFIGLLDSDGILLEANNAALEFTGIDGPQVIGRPFWEAKCWTLSLEVQEKLKRAISSAAKGEFIRYEAELLDANGRVATIDFSLKPVCDDAGRIILLIPEGRNITERKKAEEALRRSQQLLEKTLASLEDSLFLIEASSRTILSCNPAVVWMFGYSEAEVIGRNTEFLHVNRERYEEFARRMAPVLDREGLFRTEFQMRRKNGEIFPTEHSVTELLDDSGKRVAVVGIIRDISERKRVEEELEAYMKKLEQSNEALQDFASIASHDMQEPLRKIITFGDMLKEGYAGALEETGQDYLTRMRGAATRMQGLLQALLEYSRITTKAKPFSPLDLSSIVHDVLDNLEARMMQTGGRVEVGNLPLIQADLHQMCQLFQNLIGNALKFHKEGECPVVKVYGRILSDREVCEIYVEDNGIGFEEVYLDQIFSPFQRLRGRSEYEGTGMGLAICKKIVERHGWTITARSTPDGGSTFILTLPLKKV